MGRELNPVFAKALKMIKEKAEQEEAKANIERHISANFRLSRVEADFILRDLARRGLLRINGRKVKL
jgi:hypothetical protein